MTPGAFRHRFAIPAGDDGRERLYFCGNSLGLQSNDARQAVERELERWARLGVDGHFDGSPDGDSAWMPYHRLLTGPLAHRGADRRGGGIL